MTSARLALALCAATLLMVAAACGGGSDSTPTPAATPQPTATPTPSPTPTLSPNPQGVRFCDYAPGNEVATMPAEVLESTSASPAVTSTLPAQSSVSAATTQNQLAVFNALRDKVMQEYVYPGFNGQDWDAIAAGYEAMVQDGLTDDAFYVVMAHMIDDLGDHHSYFESPQEVVADDAQLNEQQNFVGIGVYIGHVFGEPTEGTVIAVYPGSPAEQAGLRPHDLLLEVDGLPIYDLETQSSRTLGEPGTSFQLTFQRGGGAPQTVTLTRRAVSGFTPVDSCLVPNTKIGYINIPTFFDESIDDQITAALTKMSADGPLDGLVLDDRINSGGASNVLEPTLALFSDGKQGSFVSRSGERDLDITGIDVGGSQTVPLVILVDRDTESFGEVFAGVLQSDGRANIIGGHTSGNVEVLHSTAFEDGSRVWLAQETFAPVGLQPGL